MTPSWTNSEEKKTATDAVTQTVALARTNADFRSTMTAVAPTNAGSHHPTRHEDNTSPSPPPPPSPLAWLTPDWTSLAENKTAIDVDADFPSSMADVATTNADNHHPTRHEDNTSP